MPRSERDINTEPCNVCGKVIRYKADIPRHARLHTTNKADLMHKCPFAGCKYQNLQKSNVATHFRTHTGEKPKSCPDCEYATSDPGSLTRHRKRIHEYEPKKRNFSGTKESRRHFPYARESSTASSSNTSSSATSSAPPKIDNQLFDVSALYDACFPPAPQLTTDGAYDVFPGNAFSYPWDKMSPVCLDSLATSESFINALPAQHNPRQLSPSLDAGHYLELSAPSSPDSQSLFDYLPSVSYEDLLATSTFSTEELDFAYSSEEAVNQTNELPWAGLSRQEGLFTTPKIYSESDNSQNWSVAFGSPFSSNNSLSTSSSPTSSSDFSFYNSPISQSNDMLNFIFPETQYNSLPLC